MKTWRLIVTTLLLLGTLTACGSQDKGAAREVDLQAFFTELQDEFAWDEHYLADIEGEMLESYYTDLSDLPVKQLVAKAPMMSAVVNELVFLQCENEDDAEKAAEILQERIDYQVGDDTNPGGAWYPESIEAWKKAVVIRRGTYVGLIASAEHQKEIVDDFNDLFD